MSRYDWSRRSIFALAMDVACFYGITGCSAIWPGSPKGWSTVLVSNAYVPVREDWVHLPAPKEMPLFSDMWVESAGGSHHFVIGAPMSNSDFSAIFVEAEAALRSSLPGYIALKDSLKEERNGLTISFRDFASKAEFARSGRLWVFSKDGATIVGALVAENLNEEYRYRVQTGLKLTSSQETAVPVGWGRVGRDEVTFAIPRSWATTGAPVGSKRWREGWADSDPDGTARVRVLLCPSTGHSSAEDALAQIESDSKAGSINGYERRKAPMSFKYGSEESYGIRVDYSYEDGLSQGVLWLLQGSNRIAAIQLSFSGVADNSVVHILEGSIRMDN